MRLGVAGVVEEGAFWDEAIRLEMGGLNIFLLDRFRPKANLQALVMSGWFQPMLRWNNFLLTFFGVKVQPSAYLCVRVRVETKALSFVYLDPDHQALIDRILRLQDGGLNRRLPQ